MDAGVDCSGAGGTVTKGGGCNTSKGRGGVAVLEKGPSGAPRGRSQSKEGENQRVGCETVVVAAELRDTKSGLGERAGGVGLATVR